uniref:WAT1-related protein n=1 Tax=Oryza brachyantha TaxID=4533 RepID=J3KXI0_ORYBR
MAKVAGVGLCLGGVLVIVFATWSLWVVLMAPLLNEYPNKLLATSLQCVLSAAQSLALAAAVERDPAAWRLRPDAGLVAVAYSGFVAWCIEKKGPVFLAMTNPLTIVFTIFCSSFFLGEIVHLGSIVGGVLMVAGLYSVLWAKSKEHDTLTTATTMDTVAGATQQEAADADSNNDNKLEQGRLASPERRV